MATLCICSWNWPLRRKSRAGCDEKVWSPCLLSHHVVSPIMSPHPSSHFCNHIIPQHLTSAIMLSHPSSHFCNHIIASIISFLQSCLFVGLEVCQLPRLYAPIQLCCPTIISFLQSHNSPTTSFMQSCCSTQHVSSIILSHHVLTVTGAMDLEHPTSLVLIPVH
jgi:hypothetical protein